MEKYWKKLFLAFLAIFSLGLGAKAQVNTPIDVSRNFVYFYSDSILYANHVRVRPDFLNTFQIRVDSKRIPLRNVKFFNTDEGFFANMRHIRAMGKEQLSERVIQGRINLFQERPDNSWFYGRWHRRHSGNDGSISMRMYFNKGYDDLKKINYVNLKRAMADDAESIDLLAGYRRSANASKAMYIAAGASIGAALVSFLITANRDKPDFDMHNGFPHHHDVPRFTSSYILLGAGAGFAIGGYAIHISSLRKLEATVDHYNR